MTQNFGRDSLPSFSGTRDPSPSPSRIKGYTCRRRSTTDGDVCKYGRVTCSEGYELILSLSTCMHRPMTVEQDSKYRRILLRKINWRRTNKCSTSLAPQNRITHRTGWPTEPLSMHRTGWPFLKSDDPHWNRRPPRQRADDKGGMWTREAWGRGRQVLAKSG